MENKDNQWNEEKTNRIRKFLFIGVIAFVCILGGCWVVSRSIQKGMENWSKSESFQNWMREQKNNQATEETQKAQDAAVKFIHVTPEE